MAACRCGTASALIRRPAFPIPVRRTSFRADPHSARWLQRVAALMVHPDRAGISQQRRRQPRGRSDMASERSNHRVPRGSRIHSEFQDERKLLLGSPALDPKLRRSGRLHHSIQWRDRATEEHQLLRKWFLPAHRHASHPHPVRLDHSPQPAEPHHHRLGPLVHGRKSAVCRRRLAADTLGGDSGRVKRRRWRTPRRHCRAATARFPGQPSLTTPWVSTDGENLDS